MFLLSREEMYDCDKFTIEKTGIPGLKLMENAGKGSAEYIRDKILRSGDKVLIFCGSGNNGGDGFVTGRYLNDWGYRVEIILTGRIDKMSEETLENYKTCLTNGIAIHTADSYESWIEMGMDISDFTLVIDAIYGVGFQGELRGWIVELIREINKKSRMTLALDIASGIEANSGKAENAIHAQITLTMAAIKYGLLLGAGKICSGKIEIIDIGIPEEVMKERSTSARLITENTVCFPSRKPYYHKGNYGKIAVIAGSPGFSGAAIMACRAALRSGAGLITLFHPRGMELIFEIQLLEVMTRTIPETMEEFQSILTGYDAVLFGPGTGVAAKAGTILEMLINNWQKPLVIDADGLNLISVQRDLLKSMAGKEVLLTPHIGEFSRLCGLSISDILSNPARILKQFCLDFQINVLLKSSTTIFCDDSQLLFNVNGNDGLATGGSGDVLSGIITSFIGQGLEIAEAGISASWLMGKTAEKLAEKRETRSIIPSDIIDNLFTV